MKSAILYCLAALVAIDGVCAKLYWNSWGPGVAHCKQWRQACRKLISNPEKVEKFAMCKIVPEGKWRVIDAACPDPNDKDPAKEAQRVQKIRHDTDDLNLIDVETYTNIVIKEYRPDEVCEQYRNKCGDALYFAGLERDDGGPQGMCDIHKDANGNWIAVAACLAGDVGSQLGWKLVS